MQNAKLNVRRTMRTAPYTTSGTNESVVGPHGPLPFSHPVRNSLRLTVYRPLTHTYTYLESQSIPQEALVETGLAI